MTSRKWARSTTCISRRGQRTSGPDWTSTRRQAWMPAPFTQARESAMKADLTRNTFDPFQHFDRVLLQQGRVQLDADWNEQAAILLHYLQALAADLIGPQGGPSNNWGFGVTPIGTSPAISNDFRI